MIPEPQAEQYLIRLPCSAYCLPFNTVLPQRGSEKKLGGGGTHISWFFWTSHMGCTFPVRLFLLYVCLA